MQSGVIAVIDTAVHSTLSIFSANSNIQKGFNPCIRGLGGVVDEKTRGRKSRVRVPFKKLLQKKVSKNLWFLANNILGAICH
jgi:hypothetical protein